MMQPISLYDAFRYCSKEEFTKMYADYFCDEIPETSRLEKAKDDVESVYKRILDTNVQAQKRPSILFVCRAYDEDINNVFCIEHDDYTSWMQKHHNAPAKLTLTDDELNTMETNDIFAAIQDVEFPIKCNFDLTEWNEILGWTLHPPCIDAYGLPYCLASIAAKMVAFGFSEECMHEVKNTLIERKKKCNKIFEKQVDRHNAPENTISFEKIVKRILGDDYTEDWYPEENRKQDIKDFAISTYKANKEYERLLLAAAR